ncbi:hypothetical protein NKI25_34400 [Mesorhizobium sp. M0808]|uniref:hypothetical protein n=1 Tax=Mesorhizobium sp. M0808 TaxID=2957002 RepID=UPI00333D4850
MRTVIHEVVADIDEEASEIVLLIHWIGGVHTELRLPRRRRGQRNSTSADILAAVRQLVLIANDDLIAGILNWNAHFADCEQAFQVQIPRDAPDSEMISPPRSEN